MMTKFKKNSSDNISIKAQDKTDWKKIYNQTQATADKEARQDAENPVLKNVKFKRLKNKMLYISTIKCLTIKSTLTVFSYGVKPPQEKTSGY